MSPNHTPSVRLGLVQIPIEILIIKVDAQTHLMRGRKQIPIIAVLPSMNTPSCQGASLPRPYLISCTIVSQAKIIG
ncbi:hypothetical protein [Scytonema sp. NUACC21]